MNKIVNEIVDFMKRNGFSAWVSVIIALIILNFTFVSSPGMASHLLNKVFKVDWSVLRFLRDYILNLLTGFFIISCVIELSVSIHAGVEKSLYFDDKYQLFHHISRTFQKLVGVLLLFVYFDLILIYYKSTADVVISMLLNYIWAISGTTVLYFIGLVFYLYRANY